MNATKELKNFENYMRNIKNRSENTITAYLSDLAQFCSIMGDYESMNDISRADVENVYIASLAACGVSATSRARKISSVRAFFHWAQVNGVVVENPVENVEMPKIPHKEPKVMADDEVSRVIQYAMTHKISDDANANFRDLSIIMLLFSSGIRRSELTEIKLSDVNLKESSILIHGKGNKERWVYFNARTEAILSEYVHSHRKFLRNAKDSEYLFVSNDRNSKSEKLSAWAINDIVNRCFDLAGVKGYTVHSTRKFFATKVYNETRDIFAVQNLLGHSNPQTTMRYVAANEKMKKEAAMVVNF